MRFYKNAYYDRRLFVLNKMANAEFLKFNLNSSYNYFYNQSNTRGQNKINDLKIENFSKKKLISYYD